MSSDRYNAEIAAAAARYQVPESWLWAIIGAESSFRDIYRTWEPTVSEYAYGPMQVLESTAASFGFTIDALQTVAGSIDAGAALVADLMRRYGSDFNRVYSAYNSGNPDKWTVPGQVQANVMRAADWLSGYVDAAASSAAPIAAPIAAALPTWLWTAAAIAALYYFSETARAA